MRVLVAGGAGYLGGALTELLQAANALEKKYEVRVYDNLTYEEHYLKDVHFIRGDVRDKKLLKEQLEWADVVVWLAAIVGDGACALNPTLTTEVNQKTVRWLAKNFDGRIVFMSTCSVYGAHDGMLTESSPTKPLSVYAATKLKAESYLKGRNAIIFRLGTLFGLGDVYSRIRLDLVVNTLTARAISEGKLTIFGGEQYRPLLHVKDAAWAIMMNLGTGDTGVFNLHNENMSIIDLARKVQTQIPCKLETVETSFEDSRNYQVMSTKAHQTFQFFPQRTVEDGIKEVRIMLQEGRIKDLNNPRYSNQGFLTNATD